MIDLLAVAEQMQRGDLVCVECGVNVVLADPFEERVFVEAELYKTATGEVIARCTAHAGARPCA